MKTHWTLALATALGAIGAPAAAPGASDDETSGTERTRSAYERAVKLVEEADYADALPVLEELNREESGNPDVLNMLGFAHRKLGRTEAAFDHYREAAGRRTPAPRGQRVPGRALSGNGEAREGAGASGRARARVPLRLRGAKRALRSHRRLQGGTWSVGFESAGRGRCPRHGWRFATIRPPATHRVKPVYPKQSVTES